MTGCFRDACRAKVRSLRVRKDNPAAGIPGPDRGASRAKVFIYPSEHQPFVEREATPILWRRLEAIAVYLGARAGELEALEWGAISTSSTGQGEHSSPRIALVPAVVGQDGTAASGATFVVRY